MRSIRRRTFDFADYYTKRNREYKSDKSFWFRFLQKANGCGQSPREKHIAETKNEKTERSDNKKERLVGLTENAQHFQGERP